MSDHLWSSDMGSSSLSNSMNFECNTNQTQFNRT